MLSSEAVERGLNALLNGAVSFAAALLLGALMWALYKGAELIRLDWVFARLFGGIDQVLRKGVARLTGAPFKARWKRWSTFTLFFLLLAAAAAFAPAPVALAVIVFAMIAVLAIYRLWEKDEDRRLERHARGKNTQGRQDLRDEMLLGVALLLFFIPLGYVRITELTLVTEGHSPWPTVDAALFVWGELTKAIPLVDWSEVFRVRNLSGVESDGRTGVMLNFAMRVLFDLLVLAGLLRTFGILRSQAAGIDLRGPEKDLESGDDDKIDAALDRIIEAAKKERRHAIAHLFEITDALRSDGRMQEHRWRTKAAKALGDVANVLTDNAQDMADLDNRLLAIEAFKRAARYLKDKDSELWATTHNNLGAALRSVGALSGDTARLEEAVAAYRAALEVHTREAMPTDWAQTQHNLGAALAALWRVGGHEAARREAIAIWTELAEFWDECGETERGDAVRKAIAALEEEGAEE